MAIWEHCPVVLRKNGCLCSKISKWGRKPDTKFYVFPPLFIGLYDCFQALRFYRISVSWQLLANNGEIWKNDSLATREFTINQF